MIKKTYLHVMVRHLMCGPVRVEREQENCTYVLSVLCIKIPLIEAVTQKLKYGYGIQFCRVWGGSEYLRVKLKEIKWLWMSPVKAVANFLVLLNG